jgi:hypothetical protein
MNPLENEIRDKLGRYLLGKISLEDFKDWFVPASWNVDHSNNQAAINMVYEIELRLAEYSNGYWSENELQQLFRPLVENYMVEPEIDPGLHFSSSAQMNWWSISLVSFHILDS